MVLQRVGNPGAIALPVMLQSLVFFLSGSVWGWLADRFGRRWAIIMPALLTIPIAPLYLVTGDYAMIVVFFTLQGAFGAGGMHVLYPAYLAERFPTEVRATTTGFVYHQGAIFGGLVAPVITYFAINWQLDLRSRCWSAPHWAVSASPRRFCSAQRPEVRSSAPNCR